MKALLAGLVALTLVAGCASATAPSGDGPTMASTPITSTTPMLTTLAKVDGWRQGLDPASMPGEAGFAMLELAYDKADAEALWDAAVPDDHPAASGAPTGVGIYGDVADVDLADRVVGLWSSGQSGSCPGWLGAVQVDEETVKLVDVADLQGGDGCTDDYNPYSQVVVLDRDQVPPREALPVEGQLTSAIVTDGTPLPGNGPVLRGVIRVFTG